MLMVVRTSMEQYRMEICMYENTIAVVDMNQGIITDTLEMEHSALAEAKYLNEDTIIYAGAEGLTCYQISTKNILWTGKPATGIAISANKNCVAGIDKENTFATIYDAITGEIIRTIDFDGKHQFVTVNDSFVNPCDNLFALNADGSLLAVSFTDGSVILYETNSDRSASFPMESGTYCHFEGGFYQQCFAFCARTQEGKWTIEVIDMDTMTPIINKQSSAVHGVYTDEDGIFLIQDTNLTHIDEQTLQDGQYQLTTFPFAIRHFSGGNGVKLLASESDICFYFPETGQSDMISCAIRPDFLAVAGGKAVIGSMDSCTVRLMQYRSLPEKQVFNYDKAISHMEARVSQNLETLMLYDDKSFSIVDKQGNLSKSGEFPDEKQVYDTQFIREENRSYLKVIYNDGKVIFYDADDGTMSEGQNDVIPDGSAYEEFETESYKITNSPHGSPEVYSRKTGKKLCDLQEDALLTDAQQIGDYLVLRYITANNLNTSLGTCYGVLLDRHFETVAHLPKLCDVINGQLVFDDPSGVISICPVYDIRTLCDEAQKGNLS